MQKEILKELQTIPGVGKRISYDLYKLGIKKVSDLRNKNPEKLYEKLCVQSGIKVGRCMLYDFRCAVYFAQEKNPKPKLLKWWNWKD